MAMFPGAEKVISERCIARYAVLRRSKECIRMFATSMFILGLAMVLNIIAPCSTCAAAESKDLFKTDINKQKAKIQKDLGDANDNIAQNKIQSARSEIDQLEFELKQIKVNLSKEEAMSYTADIEKARRSMNAREDSLVKSSLDILNAQGVDAALQYTKNDLSGFGVSQPKIEAVEKKILEEAPAIQQAHERAEIDRTLKALEAGEEPQAATDPYIVRTARRILKARADSVKSIADAKARMEMQEKEKVEREQLAKEQKEKKLEEQRQAKIKAEEDKKQKAEEERKNKETARLEKAHKDSASAFEKTQAAAAKADETAKRAKLAQEEKARQDSVALFAKAQEAQAKFAKRNEQLLAEQKEKARLDSLAERAKGIQDARARQEMLEKDKNEQDRLAKEQKEKKLEEQRQAKIKAEEDKKQKAEEERKNKETARSEKAHNDSVAAFEMAQNAAAKTDDNARRRKLAQEEKSRQDSLTALAKAQEAAAKAARHNDQLLAEQKEKSRRDSISAIKKQAPSAAAPQQNVNTESIPVRQQAAASSPALPAPAPAALNTEKPAPSLSAQEYLAGLRANQKRAQDNVTELYDILDRKAAAEALDKFKAERKFIAQYVDVQVFNTLEAAIMQTAMDMQAAPGSGVSASDSASAVAHPESKEQESIVRINGLIRDNKIDAAYAEFKRAERSLKRYMASTDFKQMKSMVENAYKVRKNGS